VRGKEGKVMENHVLTYLYCRIMASACNRILGSWFNILSRIKYCSFKSDVTRQWPGHSRG